MTRQCNLCSYQAIERQAKAAGLVVTKKHGWAGGIDVFAHPPDVTIENGAGAAGHPQKKYWKAWFMSLPAQCCC